MSTARRSSTITRGQEDSQTQGDPRAQDGEGTKREGDVRGHRDAPATAGLPATHDGQVDDRGHDRSACGSHDGQRGASNGCQPRRRGPRA